MTDVSWVVGSKDEHDNGLRILIMHDSDAGEKVAAFCCEEGKTCTEHTRVYKKSQLKDKKCRFLW